jgi:3-oxoacyl-[acyl-carrier protein] reductase
MSEWKAFSLHGRNALVTGASRGIGAAIALRLAQAGAKVWINYQSNQDAALAVLEKVKVFSPQSQIIPFNVADSAAVDAAMDQIIATDSKLDILVANAGIARDALLPRSSAEHFEEVIRTNLLGSIFCVRSASKSMMKNRYGRIVCISSVVGEMGNKGQSAYAASKSGIFGFAKSVSKELGSRNVTCNVVAPGFIETEMTSSLPEEVQKFYLENIAVKRLGSADEVASAVHFLCAEESGYISGATLDVNGGLLMR